jgi:hypothetical protein
MADSDLWKKAYRTQFGSDVDQDLKDNPAGASDVETWRASWQGGYDAGEQWAIDMIQDSGSAGSGSEQMGSQQPTTTGQSMRTFDDMTRTNPNIRSQYDTWRNQVASRGEDATDWDAFRSWLTSQGSPDPGGRPPDDFVGEDWKAQNPEWVARFGNRAA